MAGSIVIIFLLDQFPDNILHKTLETIELTHTEYSGVNTCDYTITDPLLQVVSKELQVLMVPKWLTDENGNKSSNIRREPYFNDELPSNKVIDSSSESIDTYQLEDFEYAVDKSDKENNDETTVPHKAPMLAAIFESLSNVTAQTCGGTVLNPHWVLTAASCVNLLRNLRGESKNTTEKSVYTIILNATNPLIDGSVHNVTEVRIHSIHPDDVSHEFSHEVRDKDGTTIPDVALMRIEPEAEVGDVIIVDTIKQGLDVTVYGWAHKKTDAKSDAMVPTAFDAVILSQQDCATQYNISHETTEICMASKHPENISQFTWGGPVVCKRGAILAVARGDGHAPLAAWPLTSHVVDWIHTTVIDGQ